MPRYLTVPDRDRRAESAALLCCAVLAAIALWLLLRLVWSMLPFGGAAGGVPMRVATGQAAAAPTRTVASWHLFGATPARPGEVGGAASTLGLILRGTVAEPDPKAGYAVIEGAQDGDRAYRVGEEVVPGVRLAGVYRDRIVLSHNGVDETLNMPRDAGSAATSAQPGPASSKRLAGTAGSSSASAARTAGGERGKVDWKQEVERLRHNPDELLRRVQVVPVLDGGKLSGIRVSASAADAGLLRQMGLRASDVVTAVNGQPIDSFERGRQVLSGLGNESRVRVTVMRDGKPTDLTVGLQ